MIISMADINPLFGLSLFHLRFFLRRFLVNLMKASQFNQLTPLHSRYILPYFRLPLQDNALSFTPLQFTQFTRAIRKIASSMLSAASQLTFAHKMALSS